MTVSSDRRTSLRRFLFILLATVALASTVGADDDNLGQRIVRGRVYNLDRGEGVPIASATTCSTTCREWGPTPAAWR